MTTLGGPCEHCSNPHKELWQSQCAWLDQLRKDGWDEQQIKEYAAACHDFPCAIDAGDAEMIAQNKRDSLHLAFMFIAMVVIPIGLFFFKR